MNRFDMVSRKRELLIKKRKKLFANPALPRSKTEYTKLRQNYKYSKVAVQKLDLLSI